MKIQEIIKNIDDNDMVAVFGGNNTEYIAILAKDLKQFFEKHGFDDCSMTIQPLCDKKH